jgi:hypothetical protein
MYVNVEQTLAAWRSTLASGTQDCKFEPRHGVRGKIGIE